MLDQLTRPQKSNSFKLPVVSKVLRAGGSQAGIRLIKLASLITYLNSLPAERPKPKARASDFRQPFVSPSQTPEAKLAHKLTQESIRKSRLVRQPCEVCGAQRSHAHHPDYNRPLDVQWLCEKHHRQLKRKTSRSANIEASQW
jgi:hypothetical protein